ncbi:hypothetical protein DOX11_23445, partial [Salmonella enterica subsp. enterica serovar Manhattan]|nr:hypothetical protein [Salmonella enterica subsp. enterica serovar Manhattan]
SKLPRDDSALDLLESGAAYALNNEERTRLQAFMASLDQSSADLGERPSWTTETANDQQIGAGYLDIEMQDEWETEVRIGFIKMAHDYGLTALDIDSGLIHYADGYRGIVLDQGDEIIVSPTEEQIRDAVAAMTPDGGPSILILDRAPDNYMQ